MRLLLGRAGINLVAVKALDGAELVMTFGNGKITIGAVRGCPADDRWCLGADAKLGRASGIGHLFDSRNRECFARGAMADDEPALSQRAVADRCCGLRFGNGVFTGHLRARARADNDREQDFPQHHPLAGIMRVPAAAASQ